MKTILCLAAHWAFLALASTALAESPESPASLCLAVELADGSRIIGEPNLTTLPLQTVYARLEVELKQVRTIAMEKDREMAVWEMKNGDRLKGALLLKTLPLETAFGKVEIGAEHISKIDVMPGACLKAVLPQGLILYYSFNGDESEGAMDGSGKGNNGVFHGTQWLPQGKVGGARAFNGASDYISIGFDENTGLFPADAPLSVALWFKTSASVPIEQVLVSTHYAGDGRDGYILQVNPRYSEGKAKWSPAIPGADATQSRAAVNDGQWHHAVGVWDGRQSSLYIDGILQGTARAIGPLVYPHRAPFQIGHAANNNLHYSRDEFYYFKGAMDEIMVFSRALSADEVRSLAYAGG